MRRLRLREEIVLVIVIQKRCDYFYFQQVLTIELIMEAFLTHFNEKKKKKYVQKKNYS